MLSDALNEFLKTHALNAVRNSFNASSISQYYSHCSSTSILLAIDYEMGYFSFVWLVVGWLV